MYVQQVRQPRATEQPNCVIDSSEDPLLLTGRVVFKLRFTSPMKRVESLGQFCVDYSVLVGYLEECEYPLHLEGGVLLKVFVLDDQDGVSSVGCDPVLHHRLPAGYLLLEKFRPLWVGPCTSDLWFLLYSYWHRVISISLTKHVLPCTLDVAGEGDSAATEIVGHPPIPLGD